MDISFECTSYEDFAEMAWGPRYRKLTASITITSLLGFATAYISLAKTLIPTIVGSPDLHTTDQTILDAQAKH